jgi:hypothetical protein
MKNLQRIFLAAFLFIGALAAIAQPDGGMDCNCPDPSPEDVVCVLIDDNTIAAFPSTCYAECLGLSIVEGDCNIDGGPIDPVDPFDCDCPEPADQEFICVADDFGNVFPFPSACLAACVGFDVVDCGDGFPGDGNGGNTWDCDCPEPTYGDLVCAVDEFGNEMIFTSACIAECVGLTVIDCGDGFPGGGDGNGGDPWGCDCPEPTADEWVCAVDDMGYVIPLPSACFAACMGMELADCDDNFPGNGGNPMDCDCPEPIEGELICVADELGNIFPFPSACLAECLGLEVVESDCIIDFPGDNNGGDFGCDCPEPTIDDVVTITLPDGSMVDFPSLCIAECLGLTGDGFLPGDLFGTLSFEVALNGDNDFGGAIEELDIYPNPVEDMLYLSIKANGDGVTNVKLYSLVGQIVYEEQVTLSSGTQRLELPLNNLPSGSYILGVADGNGKLVTKNVVKTN